MSSAALASNTGAPPPHTMPVFRLSPCVRMPPGGFRSLPVRLFSLGAVVALHALALLWLLNTRLPLPITPVTVMEATLIAPAPLQMVDVEPVKEIPKVAPEPPKPVKKPVPQRKEVALPQLTAAADAPTPISAPPQAPAPPEPVAIDAVPASTPAPAAAVAAVAAVAPVVTEPPPIEPPRYDAAYLSNPKPVYPLLSRRAGEEGKVLLLVLVEVDGSASKVEIDTSSGHARLDQAALEAVRRWKFVPARRGTTAIAASFIVPLRFNLPR